MVITARSPNGRLGSRYGFSFIHVFLRVLTRRIQIASSANASVAPAYSQQPNGDPIPWGVGVLVSSDATNPTSNNSTGNATAGGASPSSSMTSLTSTSSVMATTSQADPSATTAVGNVNVASANSGRTQNGKGANDQDGTDNDDGSGDDDDEDGDDDDDDSDDDDDDDGDEEDDGDDDDYARDADPSRHSGSTTSGDSDDKDGSASDTNNGGADNHSGDSGRGHESDGSGEPADDGDDGDDDDGMFASTKTLHHMRPTQTPESQGKDVSNSKAEDNDQENQNGATSDSVTSSRMEKQHSSRVTESASGSHSSHPRPSATGTLDPTLSMPARFANTDSQAQGSATASASSAETTETTDGLGDTKLASAGAPGISTAMGPAWLYVVLAAVGVVPQVVGR